jgi:hypothetical protein
MKKNQNSKEKPTYKGLNVDEGIKPSKMGDNAHQITKLIIPSTLKKVKGFCEHGWLQKS